MDFVDPDLRSVHVHRSAYCPNLAKPAGAVTTDANNNNLVTLG